jgi:mitochondrial fission protein ELM1
LATYTVILLDPKTGPNTADLFWVPEHDARRGPNVVTTLTSPHRYTPARLAELRAHVPPEIAALPHPRIAVLIGGPNGDYRYEASDSARLTDILRGLAGQGAGLMITASRRTPPDLLSAVDAATAHGARILWRGEGANPYSDFLAHADAFLVTADSVNMAGEAAATGKPVHIFHPSGGSKKFDRYHAALQAQGITRRIDDAAQIAAQWTYAPLNSAETIAAEICRRMSQRTRYMPGLCGG